MTMIRRNGRDEQKRELERAAISGDLDSAFKLYVMQRREIGPRQEHGSGPYASTGGHGRRTSEVVDTPHGQMLIRVTGENRLLVTADGRTHRDEGIEPWVVNRVPVYWHGHFYFNPAGFKVGWVPFAEDWGRGQHFTKTSPFARVFESTQERQEAQAEEHERKARHVADAMQMKHAHWSTIHAYRVNALARGDDVSQAAQGKLLRMVTPLVNEWAAAHGSSMNAAGLSNVNHAIAEEEEELGRLSGMISAAQQRIAALIVDELRLAKGQQ